MRTETAAQAKGIRRVTHSHDIPREGTRLRRLYDLFVSNKGVPIEAPLSFFEGGNGGGRLFADLIDFYGLDIRKIHNGKWVLAGEWLGRRYIDYIAQRIAEAERK